MKHPVDFFTMKAILVYEMKIFRLRKLINYLEKINK